MTVRRDNQAFFEISKQIERNGGRMFDQSKFDRDFEQSQRRFNIVFRLALTFIVITFVAIIGFWITAGVVAYKGADQIGETGVRGLAEKLWCGKTPDCKLPF